VGTSSHSLVSAQILDLRNGGGPENLANDVHEGLGIVRRECVEKHQRPQAVRRALRDIG